MSDQWYYNQQFQSLAPPVPPHIPPPQNDFPSSSFGNVPGALPGHWNNYSWLPGIHGIPPSGSYYQESYYVPPVDAASSDVQYQ